MDPIAHTMLGASLACTGLRRATPLATAALLIGANAPDVDAVTMFTEPFQSLAVRRGITHGILALPLWVFVVAGLLLAFDRLVRLKSNLEAPPARAGPLLGLAAIAVLSHPTLDWLNNYGMRWLMPFDRTWFYGDALFVIDPWIWLTLGAVPFLIYSRSAMALTLWSAFGLLASVLVLSTADVPMPARVLWLSGVATLIAIRAKNRGALVSDRQFEGGARVLIGLAAIYIVAVVTVDVAERSAVRTEVARVGVGPVEDVMVAPVPANPFAGDVVVQTPTAYHIGDWNWLAEPRLTLAVETLARNASDPLYVAAAERIEAARFLTWARYPFAEIESTGIEHSVQFYDARYYVAGRLIGPTIRIQRNLSSMQNDNPFFEVSDLPLQYPKFDLIRNEHYLPAFEAGMAEQLAEIDAITGQSEPPTFENTLVALERSGRLLGRVSSVFFGLVSAHTNDAIKAVETEIAPRLAAHNDAISLNAELFGRIKSLYEQRAELELDPESVRLIDETYREFVREGAELADDDKSRLRAINAELAELSTRFDQNVLDEVNALAIVVDDAAELAGLSQAEIQAAAAKARQRGLDGRYVIPLQNTTQQPVLTSLDNRALRQRVLETSMSRGSRGGDYDNLDLLSRIARLRAERAQLLGFATHADYVVDDETAKTVDAVNERLAALTPPAVANARREAADLQAEVAESGADFALAPWDWDYYADQVRQDRYDFDEAQLKPYFELNRVLVDGVFFAASQLYGLRFEERLDLPVYEDTVRVFEVFDHDGSTLTFFIFDPYARPSKQGGAWARRYVAQSHLLDRKAVVANHMNVTRPPHGEPALLTFDEVRTMFHEFGHALHSMFSDVTYPRFSGTNVPRDFVEYPSQLNEMWAVWPDVLQNYARHYQTGEPIPEDLLERVLEARQFNQGYATTEYLAASITDQALHQLAPEDVPAADELLEFEAAALAAAGVDPGIVPPRYHLPYFAHIMGGYSAGYYSYIWSEVLDADTEQWFRESGGMRRENGQRLRDMVLARGGSEDAMTMYRNFRGGEADIGPLLERRGLTNRN